MLSPDDFLQVVRSAPLFAIDLVVRNPSGKILLGKRTNPPARHKWFVPGGRVRRGETLDDAMERLVATELGKDAALQPGRKLMGLYTHYYDSDNFADAPGVDTHYIVAAVEAWLDPNSPVDVTAQHAESRWMTASEILGDADVSTNTKAYVSARPTNRMSTH